MVATAHGKGIILKELYEKMSGEFFSSFIRSRFNIIFVMDNNPYQTSKKALAALGDIEAELHHITHRSPDLNPIENVFHPVKNRLARGALTMKIKRETFEEFKQRVFRCCDDIDSSTIDRTIKSSPRRIDAVIKGCGSRTKY